MQLYYFYDDFSNHYYVYLTLDIGNYYIIKINYDDLINTFS